MTYRPAQLHPSLKLLAACFDSKPSSKQHKLGKPIILFSCQKNELQWLSKLLLGISFKKSGMVKYLLWSSSTNIFQETVSWFLFYKKADCKYLFSPFTLDKRFPQTVSPRQDYTHWLELWPITTQISSTRSIYWLSVTIQLESNHEWQQPVHHAETAQQQT